MKDASKRAGFCSPSMPTTGIGRKKARIFWIARAPKMLAQKEKRKAGKRPVN
jgi:hypothetical protein